MAQLALDAVAIEESYGVIKQVANSNLIEATDQLAQVLRPIEADNELARELLGECRKYQEMYNNEYLPAVTAFLSTYENLIDISEYLEKKATVGAVQKLDTGFKAGTINADEVKM